MKKINATSRLLATSKAQKDAERYRKIRKAVFEAGTLTLKKMASPEAFDKAIDNVL